MYFREPLARACYMKIGQTDRAIQDRVVAGVAQVFHGQGAPWVLLVLAVRVTNKPLVGTGSEIANGVKS